MITHDDCFRRSSDGPLEFSPMHVKIIMRNSIRRAEKSIRRESPPNYIVRLTPTSSIENIIEVIGSMMFS